MTFFIREWPNKTATLMADNGAVLWTFGSVEEAQKVCRDWYLVQVREEEAVDRVGDFDLMVASCA
jgi:hypothetical protein